MEINVVPKKTGQQMTLVLVTMLLILLAGFAYFFAHNITFTSIGLCLAVAVPAFLWPTPTDSDFVLVINEQGIFDRRLGVGVIAWEDIESAQIEVRYNNRYICLKVKSPEKYLSKLEGPKQHKVKRNRDLGFNTFNIGVNNVNVNLLEVLDFIKQKTGALR